MTNRTLELLWLVCLLNAAVRIASAQPTPNGVDVLTHRYDTWRTGANLSETVLTTRNVAGLRFGKLFEREVDGDIYAQPLLKTGVVVPGVGMRNIVYVASVNNSLYAFDADSPAANKPLWWVREEVVDLPPNQEYLNFDTKVGIVATPVIDPDTSTIYVVAYSKTGNTHRFRLHAFDLASGREKTEMHSPMAIDASYLGNGVRSVDGKICFDARKMLNPPALLLAAGVLYLAFTSHLDGEPKFDYHGWIMAYDAKTLKQLAVVNTTPDGIQGGIWQSGGGLAAEQRDGTYPLIYATVANGSVGGRNYGETLMQLYPGELMSTKQAFTPANHEYLNDRDLDRSTAPLLIPDLPIAVGALRTIMELRYRGATIRALYVCTCGARRTTYGRSNSTGFVSVGAGTSQVRAPEKSMPGGMLSLSSNGSIEGSAIVWASVPVKDDANAGTVEGILRAFDAADVEKELWNSNLNAAWDRVGMFAKFCPPVVANGKVYMATFAEPVKAGQSASANKLVVYGLLTGN